MRREWLRRDLNTLDMYSLVHADSQSTFYLVMGFIALYSGKESLFITIYAVLLLVSISLVYGEIGSRFPETGGSYLYVKQAMGRLAGFISAWMLMIDQAIMISYGTLDTSIYISSYLGLEAPPQIIAVTFSTALYILTLLGIRESARVAMAIAAMDFIIVGVLLIGINLSYGLKTSPPYYGWKATEPGDILVALSLASRGFTGVDAIGQLAGEAREPLIQIPRATFLTASIGSLYSLLLVSILMDRISYQSLSQNPAIALLMIARSTPAISWILEPLVVINTASIMLIASLAGYIAFSRLAYMLSREAIVPPQLVRLHYRYRTPYLSLTISYLISLLFILPGEVSFILEVYAIGSLFNYLMVSIALWIIGRRGELYGGLMGPRIRRVPITSIAGVILTITGLGINIIVKWSYIWILGFWLLTGFILYARYREPKEGV